MNYRTNEDKNGYGVSSGDNLILDVTDVTADSPGLEEPVTVQQFKDYARLEGFIDENESPSSLISNFDYDDDLIMDMITVARQYIEQRDNISLVSKTLSVVLMNGAGMIELPYSPIGEIESFKTEDGVDVADYTVIGTNRKRLKEPFDDYRTIEYETGAANLAMSRIEIKRIVYEMYENRKVEGFIKKYIFSRKVWLQ